MVKVVLENLSKVFGGLVAVDNLSLEVKDREFVSLLGPSGCGKTTTLNCIAGLEIPTDGNVYFDDRVVTDLRPKERGVGLVFQSYAIFRHMSVFDNLVFPLRIRGISEAVKRERVKATAELLGVEGMLERKAGRLSLSEMQKVAIGRTLLSEPKVLLLDEPLSNLEAQAKVMMRAELKRLQREVEQTTIFVTHDQLEAMTLSDRIAVMSQGKLQQYGAPSEVFDHPRNRFVANFIGSPTMNLIECSYKTEGERALLVGGPLKLDVTEFRKAIEASSNATEFTIGVRPEHVKVSTKRHAKSDAEGTVNLVELLGTEAILSIQVDTDVMLNSVVPASLKVGVNEKVWMEFDRSHLHIFSKDGDAVV
ncbi:MAG: ABC transporter ATP-binding protein [Candidatus Bathyarchaeia archaeon]